MGIKIVKDQYGNVYAKGNPAGTNFLYFLGVMLFIVGGIMILSGSLGATILAIFGTIFIYAGAHHAKKTRIKKLREAGYTPLED